MTPETLKPVYTLSPEALAKLEYDLHVRLKADGTPVTPGNDYERHLYARKLRLEGKTRKQTWAALVALGLDDIPPNKRRSYLDDVLNSILVGYSDNPLPIYEEA